MEKLGFIGMGNMALAISEGFIRAGGVKASQVYAYAPTKDKLLSNATRIGFTPLSSALEVVNTCDTIIMACKPYQISDVLEQIKDALPGKTLLSVAAGWSYSDYCKVLQLPEESNPVHIQFIMPNTPAMVSQGVFLFEEANSLNASDRTIIMELFGKLGLVIELPTKLMGIGGAITGCGPAFMDLCMEAYADAAVKYGVKRDLAYRMVAQTMLGSAKLQLETGIHPGALKDAVCSPGGTTIRGVSALEQAGFRSACIQSIDAVMNQ